MLIAPLVLLQRDAEARELVPLVSSTRADDRAHGVGRSPHARVQRRTVEQIVDAAPLVPLLGDPVPLTVDQLADVMRFFDTLQPVPEQAIEVPKILLDDVPVRTLVRDTQLVEQLVEVPTIISYSSLQRTVENHVDFPVPGREGRASGLQGFLPGQGSTALQKRISELIVEQFGDFSGGGLQDFRPGQSSSSSSHVPARASDALDAPGYGVFRTFHQNKKSATQPPHSSPWTLAAYDASMVLEEEEQEDEPVFAIEYVECDRLWWQCEWVPARQRHRWWLAAADGSQIGHTIWRPRGSSAAGGVCATMHDKFQQSWFPLWKSLQSCSSCSCSPCRMCSVPRFSSSTEWWFLPLCYRDWYAQCQTVLFWTGYDVPVVVQCQVHSSRSSWSSTSLSWRRGRFLWSRAADHRYFPVAVIDTVVVVCCAGPAVRAQL